MRVSPSKWKRKLYWYWKADKIASDERRNTLYVYKINENSSTKFSVSSMLYFDCRSTWKIISMVPKIIWSPFLYVLDLIKDVIQLSLFLFAVGGPKYAIANWSSFSSVVSFYIPRLVQTGDIFSIMLHIKEEFHSQLT